MKTTGSRPSPRLAQEAELARLRGRLTEAEATLHAIRTGDVDTVVVPGQQGPQVFTLQGAEHPYRILIESMNEGALTLTADHTILYANQCFARMVRSPLEKVIGGSFRRYLSAPDRASLGALLKGADPSGAKIQVMLHARDHSQMPVQISTGPRAGKGLQRETIGIVVTDLSEARHNEDMLRALAHRVVQVQEEERGRVALELHENITQLLCAVLVRSQALANRLSADDGTSKREAIRLREMLGETAEEVERISRNLRPGALDQLGLIAVLQDAGTEFAERTGVSVRLVCLKLATRLPADIEVTLYRIFQEALNNVEKHARARHVTIRLGRRGNLMQMTILDDGLGFDPDPLPARRERTGGLGILGMCERAASVGGTLKIRSARSTGTEIEVRTPLVSAPGA